MENDKMKIHIQITSDDGIIYHGDAVLQKHGTTVKRPIAESSSKPQSHKCPDVITLLWRKGNFKRALSLADVKKALDATEYSFTGKNILMTLSRVKFLTRHGSRRFYTWKQKYPFH
jgi:hypothetical protein